MLTTHIVSISKELTETQIATQKMRFKIQDIAETSDLRLYTITRVSSICLEKSIAREKGALL